MKYVLLGTLSPEWAARHGPRVQSSKEKLEQLGIKLEAVYYTQALMATEAYQTSREERKKIETLFGEVKHVLSRARLRLRGLWGAWDEFLLIATVQNLKRLAQHRAIPPPQPATA